MDGHFGIWTVSSLDTDQKGEHAKHLECQTFSQTFSVD